MKIYKIYFFLVNKICELRLQKGTNVHTLLFFFNTCGTHLHTQVLNFIHGMQVSYHGRLVPIHCASQIDLDHHELKLSYNLGKTYLFNILNGISYNLTYEQSNFCNFFLLFKNTVNMYTIYYLYFTYHYCLISCTHSEISLVNLRRFSSVFRFSLYCIRITSYAVSFSEKKSVYERKLSVYLRLLLYNTKLLCIEYDNFFYIFGSLIEKLIYGESEKSYLN